MPNTEQSPMRRWRTMKNENVVLSEDERKRVGVEESFPAKESKDPSTAPSLRSGLRLRVTLSEQFKASPALFIETAIKDYIAHSPANRLPTFDNEPIYDEPLVGFADGDDPIFHDYKTIIGDFHLTPRESLELSLREKSGRAVASPEHVSVISWVLPFTYNTRLSLRRETLVPSLRWNNSRWYGQELVNIMSKDLVSLIEGFGRRCVNPELEPYWKHQGPDRKSSNWSQRHIAYAAGLGTFSLSRGLITAKGIAMRCYSLVTDIGLPATPRTYDHHLAHCLFFKDKSCTVCIERCPGGAITESGMDKLKCSAYRFKQKDILKESGKYERFIGDHLCCGLCQTKVPCEARIPPAALAKNRKVAAASA